MSRYSGLQPKHGPSSWQGDVGRSASELKQRLLVVTSRLRNIDTQQQQLTLERAALAAESNALHLQCKTSEHAFEPEPALREVIVRALEVRATPPLPLCAIEPSLSCRTSHAAVLVCAETAWRQPAPRVPSARRRRDAQGGRRVRRAKGGRGQDRRAGGGAAGGPKAPSRASRSHRWTRAVSARGLLAPHLARSRAAVPPERLGRVPEAGSARQRRDHARGFRVRLGREQGGRLRGLGGRQRASGVR